MSTLTAVTHNPFSLGATSPPTVSTPTTAVGSTNEALLPTALTDSGSCKTAWSNFKSLFTTGFSQLIAAQKEADTRTASVASAVTANNTTLAQVINRQGATTQQINYLGETYAKDLNTIGGTLQGLFTELNTSATNTTTTVNTMITNVNDGTGTGLTNYNAAAHWRFT